jgi:SAM-dependent methyltransferase
MAARKRRIDMAEITLEEAVQYVESLPPNSKTQDQDLLDPLDARERLVFRIAENLFERMELRNKRDFLYGIFVDGRRYKERDFEYIRALIADAAIVMDVGCGWGGLTQKILAAGKTAYAVDHVFEHAAATKLLCPEARVFQSDARKMDFLPDSSVDCAILMGVIEHIGEPSVPRGRSGMNLLQQYNLIRELSRVTRANGGLFVSTGNYAFPRDGEVNRWFYHWLPPEEQTRYNNERNITADWYWLLTWEEMATLLTLCGYEVSSVISPDADHWEDILINRLALCCQDLDETMTSILKRMVRENPRFFASWLVLAVKKGPPFDGEEGAAYDRLPPPIRSLLGYFLFHRVGQLMDWERLVPRASALAKMPECIDNRQVLIWGTGSGGERAHRMLKAVGIEVVGFIDNAPQADAFCGRPVSRPEQLLMSARDSVYIFIGSMFVEEIEKQLRSYGFRFMRDYLPIRS